MFDITKFVPRIHQDQLNKQLVTIKKDTTIALKTGAGKTKLFFYNANYGENANKKILFIVPEISLAWQTKIQSDMGILQGSSKLGLDKRLQVAVIHTVTNMEGKHVGKKDEIAKAKDVQLSEFLSQYDEIWVDEAHDQIPRQERIRKLFKGKMVYLTATPYNGKGEWLDHLVQTSVIGLNYSYTWMKEQSYLIPAMIYTAGELDTSSLKQNDDGEYQDAEIMEKIENSDIDIVDTVEKQRDSKYPTITMCQNKAHAQKLSDDFNKKGIKTYALYAGCKIDIELPFGETKQLKGKKAINYILDALKEGSIENVCFVKMLIKGVDAPIIGNAVIATKTQNIAVLAQFLGRGVRTYEGMSHLNVIDIFGSIKGIGLNPLDFAEPTQKKPKKSRKSSIKCLSCKTTTPLKTIEDYIEKDGTRVVIKKCEKCGEEEVKVETPPVIICKKCNITSLATETIIEDRVVYSVCPHCGDREEMSRVYPRELIIFDMAGREEMLVDIEIMAKGVIHPTVYGDFVTALKTFGEFADTGYLIWIMERLIKGILTLEQSKKLTSRMMVNNASVTNKDRVLKELCDNDFMLYKMAMEIVEHTRIERVINKLQANKRNNNKLPLKQQLLRYKSYIVKEKGLK